MKNKETKNRLKVPSNPHLQMLLEELRFNQVKLELQNNDLRIANEKLKLQQLKLSRIYDLAPIGYFILDRSGMVNDVNNAGIAMLNTTRLKIINNRLQSFISLDEGDAFHIYFQAMLNSGEKKSGYFKIIAKGGREIHVQMEGIAIAPVRTLPFQCNIVVIDISERNRTEKTLAKTKERLELALEVSSSGTWELELDTMKFHLDEFIYQTCIVPGGSFDGQYQTFINLVHPNDRVEVDRQFRIAFNNQKSIDLMCRFDNRSSDTRFASIRGHISTEPGQANRFIGIMTDITAKRKMEHDALRLKNNQQKKIALAIIHAEENERTRISDALHNSVSQLLYGIRIKMGTLFDAADPGTVMRDIYCLLDMAILETRNISFELAPAILSDFGLRATIEEMAKRLSTPKMLIKTKLTRLNERRDLPLEATIFRIIQELVNNALKHSGASMITLEVKKGKIIELCVSDNGKGFEAVKLKDIASGSGLTSIKNRLSLYSGALAIESKPGFGTKVKIELQLVVESL